MNLERRRSLSATWLAALGLVVGIGAVALLAAPRIDNFEPSPDSVHISSRAPVEISFNTPMEPASVEGRLSLEPRTPGRIEWNGQTLIFRPLEPWPAGAQVRVRLAAGAASTRILPTWRSYTWEFQVSLPRLVYLWPASGSSQLYSMTVQPDGDSSPQALTEDGSPVIDFTVAPNGGAIVYTRQAESGGSELWKVELQSGEADLLYVCPEGDRCQSPAISPDGGWLAFERFGWQEGEGGRRVPGRKGVWLLEVESSGAARSVGETDHYRETPAWSPTGLLAFYDATLRAVTLVDPRPQPDPTLVSLIPNGLGLLGSWTPDGASLILPEILLPAQEDDGESEGDGHDAEPDFFSHLFVVNALTASEQDLSGQDAGLVEDASPAISPDGRWVAFARKFLDERWTPGRQLWIMRTDGSQATALTQAPDYHHSAFAWSADSQQLAYMRFNQTDPSQPPTIWVTDPTGATDRMLLEDGYLPQWIP